MYSNLDSNKYETLLKSVASLSRLYSDSEVPLIHSRFIEKLFVETSLNEIRDLSRQDISFDCLVNKNTGVGIKTFRGDTNVSLEKIAEFNNLSSSFEGLDTHALAEKVTALWTKSFLKRRIFPFCHKLVASITYSFRWNILLPL